MNKTAIKRNHDEIVYNLINSAIAGLLVFFGAFIGTGGVITFNGTIAALASSFIVMLTKFKDYWTTQEKEYRDTNKYNKRTNIFTFI